MYVYAAALEAGGDPDEGDHDIDEGDDKEDSPSESEDASFVMLEEGDACNDDLQDAVDLENPQQDWLGVSGDVCWGRSRGRGWAYSCPRSTRDCRSR